MKQTHNLVRFKRGACATQDEENASIVVGCKCVFISLYSRCIFILIEFRLLADSRIGCYRSRRRCLRRLVCRLKIQILFLEKSMLMLMACFETPSPHLDNSNWFGLNAICIFVTRNFPYLTAEDKNYIAYGVSINFAVIINSLVSRMTTKWQTRNGFPRNAK